MDTTTAPAPRLLALGETAPHPQALVQSLDVAHGVLLFAWADAEGRAIDSGRSLARFTPITLEPEEEGGAVTYADPGDEILIAALAGPSEADQLATAKIALRDLAKARRAELVTSGFTFRDKLIQTRSTVDVGNINSTALAALSAPSLTTDWITADNSTLPLDAAGVIEMQLTMTGAGNAIYAAFLAITAQIETAPDLATLSALKPIVETFTA